MSTVIVGDLATKLFDIKHNICTARIIAQCPPRIGLRFERCHPEAVEKSPLIFFT